MNIPTEAISQLLNHQRQLDPEGIMVGVSRQALDELLTAYNELLAAKGWLPIESAPKDGTRILVYSPQSPPPGIYACYWGVSEQAWLFDVGLGAYQPRTSAATHWQPLPPAPGSDGGL